MSRLHICLQYHNAPHFTALYQCICQEFFKGAITLAEMYYIHERLD